MGQSAADFSGVSTSGLLQRLLRRLEARTGVTTSSRQRLELAKLTNEILEEALQVQKGELPEEPFRAKLIELLNPHIQGGWRGVSFKW